MSVTRLPAFPSSFRQSGERCRSATCFPDVSNFIATSATASRAEESHTRASMKSRTTSCSSSPSVNSRNLSANACVEPKNSGPAIS